MIRYFCDKCGKEINNQDAIIVSAYQNKAGGIDKQSMLCPECYETYLDDEAVPF